MGTSVTSISANNSSKDDFPFRMDIHVLCVLRVLNQGCIGFSIKAVDVETGVIIWKENHTKTIFWNIFDVDSPASLAREVAKKIIASFLERTTNP